MNKKIDWLLKRLMGMYLPWEILYRIKQQIQRLYDRIDRKFPSKITKVIFQEKNFEFSEEILGKILPKSQNYNEYNFFNISINNISEISNWEYDYKNNKEVKKRSKYYERQDFENNGEIKYIYEISRLHYLPVLAALGLVRNQEKQYHIIEHQLSNWIKENEYLQSINWYSGIEIGIRSVNLVYTRLILEQYKFRNNDFITKLDRHIYLHFYYLSKHLSLYSSANNHLLAELSGIFVICKYYQFSKSQEWQKKSLKLLLKELDNQFYEDGFNKEFSTHYHIESVNYYLLILSLLDMNSKEYGILKNRLKNSIEILYELNETQSHTNQIGDNDEGELLYPYFDEDYSPYRSILMSGFLIYKDDKYLNKVNHFDFKNYLLHGNKGFEDFQNIPITKIESNFEESKFFKKSGLIFFKNGNNRLFFNVGQFGLHFAAHAHSDLLHFTFSANNFPYIIDIGTYQYHQKYLKWRNYFKGVEGHNTIGIDGLDQAQNAGRMIWYKIPQVKIIDYDFRSHREYCKAIHNGYIKQGINVEHTRKIVNDKNAAQYKIVDSIKSKDRKKHICNFNLHFNPYLESVIHKNDRILLFNNSHTYIEIINKAFSQATIINGDDQKPCGWYSPSYDVKIPTWNLKLDIHFDQILELKTIIKY